MARIKRSMWNGFFKSMVASARRLIKHPKQLGQIIEDALNKMRKHSTAIREIIADFQIIIRLVKAWLAGDYEDISGKPHGVRSLLLLFGSQFRGQYTAIDK